MLNKEGYVADASGENIFMVRDGALLTPPLSACPLAGITRDSIIKIATDLAIPVFESAKETPESVTSAPLAMCVQAAPPFVVRRMVPKSPTAIIAPARSRPRERCFAFRTATARRAFPVGCGF